MAVKRSKNIIIVDLNAEIDSGWKDGTLIVSLEDDKFYRMESGSAVEVSAGGGGGVSDGDKGDIVVSSSGTVWSLDSAIVSLINSKANALGADDNYVTDAEKIVIGNTSGVNTGDNAVNSNYSGLATSKQDTLVSGTNIKTVNGNSLLGSGDLSVTAADHSYAAGTFTVATGTYKLIGKLLELTSTQRASVIGTGRLAIKN